MNKKKLKKEFIMVVIDNKRSFINPFTEEMFLRNVAQLCHVPKRYKVEYEGEDYVSSKFILKLAKDYNNQFLKDIIEETKQCLLKEIEN